MIYAMTTLFSTVIWFLINRLILSAFSEPTNLAARMYLVLSTMAVAIITVVAMVLAVAAIG